MKDSAAKRCTFCNGPLGDAAKCADRKYHAACATAYGLDYDPKSEADAQEFLARRKIPFDSMPGRPIGAEPC